MLQSDLTKEKILSFSGEELDKLVSVHIMDYEIREIFRPGSSEDYDEFYFKGGQKYENVNYPDEWQPSKYMEPAWLVVEKMKEKGKYLSMHVLRDNHYLCCVTDTVECADESEFRDIEVEDKSMQLAICKAALLAVLGL
jgi:hypothetical protein